MKKILFFNPPLYFHQGIPKSLDVSVPPLGLLYLASYINHYAKKEFNAKIIDIGKENFSLKDIVSIIKKETPFVIGISSMTPQLQGAVELAKNIKKHFPKSIIFLGGPHISADPDFIKRHSKLFDYAITGESEITFLDSIIKLSKNQKIQKIQASQIPLDLNKLPIPDKKLIKRHLYNQAESMLFSRGCPFNCYYCSRPSISRTIRYRSTANLIKEIKYCYPFCNGKINFQDDTFTLNKDKVVELCKTLIKEKIKIFWECNTRIDLVDEKLLKLMNRAGCQQINFGIESGNERVRKEIIHKGLFTNKDISKVFNWCQKYKIKIACYFMMGHPTETKKEIQDTKDMILKSPIDILGLSIPIPFPGSPLYDIAKKDRIVSKDIIDKFVLKKLGEGYSGIYPVYTPKDSNKEFVYSQLKEINRKFYLKPKIVFRKIKEDFTSPQRIKSDFKDLFSLIFRGMSSRKPYIIQKQK
ncbi:MAG: radical SAM protein [Candidatus Shapirobacteria bacterium]|nr:radical SAM protein [Candidatus Shapirobacteria bacterium]